MERTILLSDEDKDLYNYRIYKTARYPSLWFNTDYGREKVQLHRLVMRRVLLVNLPSYRITGYVVDHINGNTFDARRENLRLIKQKENILISRKKKAGTSKYLRVSWSSVATYYTVQLTVDGVKYYGGYYANEVEAAYWADVLALKHQGEKAVLNFPDNVGFYREEVDQKTINE